MIIIMKQSFSLIQDVELIELTQSKGKMCKVKDVEYLKIEEDETES